MMTLIILAGEDPAPLVPTLQSVFPAIADGVVRDGLVIMSPGSREIASVADAAGCDVFEGEATVALPQAVRAARAGHVLLLEAGCVLETDWWREAARHLERGIVDGPRAARFTPAGEGPFARLLGLMPSLGSGADLRCGLIAPASALRDQPSYPPRLPMRPVRLRSRIYRVSR